MFNLNFKKCKKQKKKKNNKPHQNPTIKNSTVLILFILLEKWSDTSNLLIVTNHYNSILWNDTFM